ncbi:unnamed protein product [Heligmosomoides polygyrus]|uniref:DUF1573 domain-containing protein n=1 Tax=Heligmosomoides polygyrus TaxID=6339 RepID=A0A183FWV2_HELPZ|nr:unnamed protein product [Heligmosomoides polygyrus]
MRFRKQNSFSGEHEIVVKTTKRGQTIVREGADHVLKFTSDLTPPTKRGGAGTYEVSMVNNVNGRIREGEKDLPLVAGPHTGRL